MTGQNFLVLVGIFCVIGGLVYAFIRNLKEVKSAKKDYSDYLKSLTIGAKFTIGLSEDPFKEAKIYEITSLKYNIDGDLWVRYKNLLNQSVKSISADELYYFYFPYEEDMLNSDKND